MSDNVVLLVLDTVRKDYFDEYAPRLRALSDVSFEQCRAASSTSVPSHASIITGELPHQHGIHSFNPDYTGLTRADTFLGGLPDHRTFGVSANTFAGSSFGFDGVFDEFTDVSWTRRFPDGMDVKEFAMTTEASGVGFYTDFLKTAIERDHTLKTTANAGLAQLDVLSSHLPFPRLLDDGAATALKTARRQVTDSAEPFFLFVNLMDAHTPHQHVLGYDRSLHDVPNSWSSINDLDQWAITLNGADGHETDVDRFRQLYAASIDYLDRKVAAFVEAVREGTDGETRFVVTADHGENLGYDADGGMFGHKSSLTEALLHVPLYVVNPPDGYAERERGYFSHLELGRLIAGLARGETPDVFAERVPAELIGTTNVPEISDRERAYWRRMIRCVYDGERKVTWDSLGETVAYTLDHSKPCWQALSSDGDAPVSVPGWAGRFFTEEMGPYKRRFDSTADVYVDVDEFTKDRLESLGYL